MHVSESMNGHTLAEQKNFIHQNILLRADIYNFLAGTYLNPPSQEFIEQIMDQGFAEQVGLLLGEEVVAPLRYIHSLSDIDESFETLQQEYMDLFVVPTGRYVTPFEDVYRGLRLDGKQERGPLLGDRAVAIKIFYRNAGADMDKTCMELPTHIGVELSFMSYLCRQEAQASVTQLENNADNESLPEGQAYKLWQLKFLHEHLTDWFPQLSRIIQKNAQSPFYSGLARFTEAFIEQDKQRLKTHLTMELKSKASELENSEVE